MICGVSVRAAQCSFSAVVTSGLPSARSVSTSPSGVSANHRITSSALNSNAFGIVIPNAFGFCVDRQLEPCRLLHRQLAGVDSLENLVDVLSGEAENLKMIGP
jgi:hypothetical protein